MARDIYGGQLGRGHCEVHPHVGEEYPCSLCMNDRKADEHGRMEEEDYYRAQEAEYYLSLVENTGGAGI